MRQRQSSQPASRHEPAGADWPALLFDLDGTLIDSNYQHVAAWSEALRSAQIVIPEWKIHRRIGMSGKSFLKELLRELPKRKTNPDLDRLETRAPAQRVDRMTTGGNELAAAALACANPFPTAVPIGDT